MRRPPYEEIEHTADWAIIVRGDTLAGLFEHAAEGMFFLLNAKHKKNQARKGHLSLAAIDRETLLVSWLEELLYLLEMERVSADNFHVNLEDQGLNAEFDLYPVDSIKKDIKAVTYNELKIVKDEDGFHTTIVFDV
jgi:SHS2 domain-containing protein